MSQQNNYSALIQKLDTFIRKYYLNQLIRGLMYSIGLVGLLFLLITLLESYYFFGQSGRKVLFFSFIGISFLAIAKWILLPLMHFFNLGKVISHEKAANIIGDHFGDVKDKLLNILQLKKQAGNSSLAMAGINQKTEEIKLVSFPKAIDLGKNKKYLRYAIPPLMLLFAIFWMAPSLIKDSTARLINNGTDFERADAFAFALVDDQPTVVQYDDYDLVVKIEGDQLPNEVFIDVDNYQYRLTKDENDIFSYRFSNVQKDTKFKLFAAGDRGRKVESKAYDLSVLKKPNITGFDIELDYPSYTNRKDETLQNIGDLVVPQGTKLKWIFNSLHTDEVAIKFSNTKEIASAERFSNNLFSFKKRALYDELYKLYISNAALPKADSISYSLNVIPDLKPSIQVEKFVDSLDSKLFFFAGEAGDDYGLRSLTFNYRVSNTKGLQGELVSVPLEKPAAKNIQYTHKWDINELELKPGDNLSYYFEVYDNDGINGAKFSRTEIMSFEVPTIEEFEKQESDNNEDIKEDLKQSMEESKKIQKEMKKLRDKVLQKKDLDWQTKKDLEKLLERQKELEKKIEEAKKKFEENLKNQEQFDEKSEDILKKQEKLQELFEEVMSDEMKELMKQIEDLMEEMNKDNALEMMEQMEMNDEELEMELDRLTELFKNLEVEADMEKAIEKLEELAKEQEELSEETEKGETPQEELEKKQEEINEEFEKLEEKMEEIEKKNEALERPKDLGENNEEKMDEISEEMKESSEQLEQQENKKASESQKNASEKMQEMADQMKGSMESGEMEQMEEDMEALRQLLENLVNLSFDQEDVMDDVGSSTINTPIYIDLVQQQYKLKDDFKLVEDSLQALAKRVFQIESFVTEKVGLIKKNLDEGLDLLEDRKKPQAANNQQRTMKNVNDLALMLNEVMQQMQEQMSSMMPGNQNCSKPGGKGSKPGSSGPADKLSKGQQGLKEMMEKMKEGAKNGKGPGSKEFAKMAAKQAALQKALREMKKAKQEQGQGGQELQEIIDQMNQNEIDLVNKRLTNEMMKRQQDILTKLLKAENADRQREYDNKRKAQVAEQKERKMPPTMEEYIKKRESEIELYKTVNPALRPYYKNLVEEYINQLKTD